MLKKFASYYKPHMKMFILDMIAAFIVSVADLFYPRIAQNIINDYVPNKNLQMLLIWSGALLLIYLIKMLLNFFMQYQGHMVGIGIQSDMRKEAFKRLQKLPFAYFDENKTPKMNFRRLRLAMEKKNLDILFHNSSYRRNPDALGVRKDIQKVPFLVHTGFFLDEEAEISTP